MAPPSFLKFSGGKCPSNGTTFVFLFTDVAFGFSSARLKNKFSCFSVSLISNLGSIVKFSATSITSSLPLPQFSLPNSESSSVTFYRLSIMSRSLSKASISSKLNWSVSLGRDLLMLALKLKNNTLIQRESYGSTNLMQKLPLPIAPNRRTTKIFLGHGRFLGIEALW